MKKRKCIRNKPRLNMQLRKKAISMVLILSLLMAWMIQPLSSSAGELGTSSTQPEVQEGAFTPIQDGTLSAEKVVLKAADLKKTKDAVVIQYIGEEQFDSGNHTMRLKEHEDLHTFVFQNLNGTRTMYVMDEDVKYIDANGETIDKDITLVSTAKGFGIVQNEVELLIPQTPQTGISVEHEGYSIKLTPQGIVTRASAKQEDNSVVYEGAFGTNTSLKYTPLLSGIKEDIILTSYMPNVRYTFMLETDGLRVRQNEGKYCLVDPAKRDPVFYLGDILVYDAIGKPDMGTMTVTTVEEGEKYLFTITVDDEFLADPTTEYPVTIDPTITVSDSTTSGSIEDAPIFQNYPNTNFGTYAYNRVGTPSAAYGVGRTVIRLRGLIDSLEYTHLMEEQILEAYFYVTEASGGAAQTVELYPLTNTTWKETNVTWYNVGSYSTAFMASASLSYNKEAKFDIKNLVHAWKDGSLNEEAGFVLKHSNESLNKAICSSEFSTAAKRPRVVLTYESMLSIEPTQVNVPLYNTYQLEAVTLFGGYPVSWESDDEDIATVSQNGLVTAKKIGTTVISAQMVDYNGIHHGAYCLVTVYFGGGEYYLRNKQSSYYADIYVAYLAEGNLICQSEFDRHSFQKWIFEETGDGYYTIRSKSTPSYYMGVDGDFTTSYSDIVLRSGTITDGMKWKIEITSSGAYRLIPKSGEATGCVLATALGSYGTESLLQQISYTNDNVYQDEWELRTELISIVNYYDSTFANNPDKIAKIADAIEFATRVYSYYFSVDIQMEGAPIERDFGIDDCGQGVNAPCEFSECGDSCHYEHHKNGYRIANAIYNSEREDDHIYVLWTDHPNDTFCQELESNQHRLISAKAMVFNHWPIVHIMNIPNEDNESGGVDREMASMAILLVHELTHVFGMDDVYEDPEHSESDEGCIMRGLYEETVVADYTNIMNNINNNVNDQTSEPLFCSQCHERISSCTSNAVIQGNIEGDK